MTDVNYNNNKQVELMLKFLGYHPSSIFLRFFVVSLLSVITIQIIKSTYAVMLPPHDVIRHYDYLIAILFYNILSESYIVMNNTLDKYIPFPANVFKRILAQFILTVLLVTTVAVIAFFCVDILINVSPGPAFYMGISIGLIFTVALASFMLVSRLIYNWMSTQQQLAQVKEEKLRMDYNHLQDQLNPHFLFNNLSVLKSLIIYDRETAVEFTENFTDVYRYVLKSKGRELIKLNKELEFIDSYIGLHKERLGDGLKIDITIDKECLNKHIAPLTLQLLIENAIKHNITSKDMPLNISITANMDKIKVTNTINKKETSYSTHTGLTNLANRYNLLSDQKIIIDETNNTFSVEIPLL